MSLIKSSVCDTITVTDIVLQVVNSISIHLMINRDNRIHQNCKDNMKYIC